RRFLPARVLRHRSCFPGRLAAVQPTERVSARRRPARLPRTGHPAHPGVHLWRHPGTGGTTIGAPPVAKLGWVENTKPADRQNLKLGNPNFAEVGFCCSYLKPQSSSPPIPYPWKGGSLRLNFGIQAKVVRRCGRHRAPLSAIREPDYCRGEVGVSVGRSRGL